MYPFSEGVRQALFLVLPSALVLLALACPWLDRRASRALERLHALALALVVLLGFGLYTTQNWEKRRYFNPYEFFHYYVGSKYARELGYTRLYDAAVLVDRETGRAHRSRDVANLSAHRGGPQFKRLSAVYADEQAIRAPFSGERWQEFTRDVVFFRDQLTEGMWEQLLHDKGFNATPVWTLLGGTLANLVPTSSRAGLRLLAALDPLLLAGAFACVGRAFGRRALLFALALYLTHYCTSHAHFRAAFLRADWLAALVASACCLKKERPFLAGSLLAWSALLRVFPLLFAFGPLVVLAWSAWRRSGAHRAALSFAAGLALAGAALFAASLARSGPASWQEFGAKIVEHDERPASDTLGFRKLFLWTIDFRRDQGHEIRALFERRAAAWWTVQALLAAGLAWLLHARRPHAALCLSFALVWFLAAPAYYYYAFLLVPLLYLAEQAGRPARAAGLAALFATSLLARAFHEGPEMGGHFAFKLSLVMGALVLIVLAGAAIEGPADRAGAQDARSGP